MAKCKYCGAKAGFITDICPSCLEERKNIPTDVVQQETSATSVRQTSQSANGQEQRTDSLASIPSKYGTARGVSGFGEFLGWLLVVIGVFLVIGAASNETGVLGFVVPASTCIAGLYLVMAAQFIRATVDNADTTREILRLMQTRK